MQFKAQTFDHKWIEGSLVHQTDFYGDTVDDYFIIDGTWTNDYDIGEPVRVDPETICQFTGLYDRHKTPIYEHDRVLDHESEQYGEIVWFEEQAAFYVFEDDSNLYSFDVINEREELDVVGNIYDKEN